MNIENARMSGRHGEAWGQIGTHDYPCFASKPRTRNLRWLVYGLLGAVGLITWAVLG